MAKAPTDMLIVDRCYKLVMWGCDHIASFPRSRRPTLGDRGHRGACLRGAVFRTSTPTLIARPPITTRLARVG